MTTCCNKKCIDKITKRTLSSYSMTRALTIIAAAAMLIANIARPAMAGGILSKDDDVPREKAKMPKLKPRA